jgi:hypothetical protein
MLQLYVTVFFYKVSFLKKEIDTDQKYKVVNELSWKLVLINDEIGLYKKNKT